MSGGNEVELFPGDELQIDGGVLVVETVGIKSAEGVLKGGDGKLVEVRNPYPKHLVLSRGNKPEVKTSIKATEVDFPVRLLASANRSLFIERPRKPKAGMVRLEPGDQLCHGGEVRTVVEVTDKAATIENDAGQQFKEKRVVNEFLFTDCNTNEVRRLDAAQRAAHLKEFLATRKPPVAGDNKPSGEQETVMAKKAKVKKVKTEKKSKVVKVSYAGRPEFIAKLVAKGETDAAIMEAVKAEYPGSSKGNVVKTIAAKRSKSEKSK